MMEILNTNRCKNYKVTTVDFVEMKIVNSRYAEMGKQMAIVNFGLKVIASL